jgi:hypothetical protein
MLMRSVNAWLSGQRIINAACAAQQQSFLGTSGSPMLVTSNCAESQISDSLEYLQSKDLVEITRESARSVRRVLLVLVHGAEPVCEAEHFEASQPASYSPARSCRLILVNRMLAGCLA